MEETQDLLTDIITETRLVQANTGKRLANFLIDYIAFIAVLFCIGILWAIISPDTVSTLNNANDTGLNILDRIISMILYALFLSALEALTKGRSLGKLITGTKAVNEDGSNITAGTAFKRGFSRIVPFEIFSAFGNPPYPWHDKWNHTYVIDLKQSSLLPDAGPDTYQ